MIELRDWLQKDNFPDKPWLLLGKGPTFSRRGEFDLGQYNLFALNHVVREQKVLIAHIIDIDVVEACAENLAANCDWLIMPRVPNVRFFPGEYLGLHEWLQIFPVLRTMEAAGRLITYDFAHETKLDDPWTIAARFFSSEIALGILGRLGVKHVHTLGIDGGQNYSHSFQDLADSTLLAAGLSSFDLQFERLRLLCSEFGMALAPLIENATAPSTNSNHDPLPQAQPYPVYREDMPIEEEYRTLAQARQLVDTRFHAEKAEIAARADLTLATKLQMLEDDLRRYRLAYEETYERLANVAKDLVVASERLGWARDEVKEYRAHILGLEEDLHSLVRSRTWKLGRAFTKPAEAIRERLKRGPLRSSGS